MRLVRAQEFVEISDATPALERIAEDRRARMQRVTGATLAEQIPCPGGCGAMAALESPIEVTRDGITRKIQVAQCLGSCRRESRNPRTGRVRMVAARFDLELPQTPGSEAQVDAAAAVPNETEASEAAQPSGPTAKTRPLKAAQADAAAAVPNETEASEAAQPPGPPAKTRPLKAAQADASEAVLAKAQESEVSLGPEPDAPRRDHQPPQNAPADTLPLEAAQADASKAVSEGQDFMAELAQSMKAMGLTQTEMGQLIGCSQSSISKLLRGQPVALSTVQAARAWLQSISDEADPRQVEERPEGLDAQSAAADPIPMAAPEKPSPVPLEAGLPPDNAPEPESRPGLEEGLVPPSPLVETVTSDPVLVSGPAFQVDDRLSAAGSPETVDQGQPSSWESCGDPAASEGLLSPYEAVLRTMLEQVAQKHLEEVAGPAAAGVVVRVTLEWRD